MSSVLYVSDMDFPCRRFQERENLNSARGVRLRAQAANIGSTVKKESGHIVKSIKQKVGPGDGKEVGQAFRGFVRSCIFT